MRAGVRVCRGCRFAPSDQLTDLAAGGVDFVACSMPEAEALIKAGRIRIGWLPEFMRDQTTRADAAGLRQRIRALRSASAAASAIGRRACSAQARRLSITTRSVPTYRKRTTVRQPWRPAPGRSTPGAEPVPRCRTTGGRSTLVTDQITVGRRAAAQPSSMVVPASARRRWPTPRSPASAWRGNSTDR